MADDNMREGLQGGESLDVVNHSVLFRSSEADKEITSKSRSNVRRIFWGGRKLELEVQEKALSSLPRERPKN